MTIRSIEFSKIDSNRDRASPASKGLPEKGTYEFHVSRTARDAYQFDLHLFSSSGNVIFANFHAARLFAQKMNDKRDLVKHPDKAVKAGQINAMGLIDEILHGLIEIYREQVNPRVFQDAADWLEGQLSPQELEKALRKFLQEFPPVDVYQNKIDVQTYLKGSTHGRRNREIALEEMLMLWISNLNPAFSPFMELFDDTDLEKQTRYLDLMKGLSDFFDTQPFFGPDNMSLIRMLRLPAIEHPESLEAQLRFIRDRWGALLGRFLLRLLSSLDFIKEESRVIFWGPPLTEVPEFGRWDYEPERFSPDMHWMPRLVLLAKSTLVWLDQLSRTYQRSIHRLDQIPDEELDKFARWGITGLWLIGIFERSQASKKIKQMCGNPEAESSAYSLFDYKISHELGGYEALQNLKERCWQRGIRLGCDMVPNHTGIDSRWIREHPEWYISLPYPPFPSYSFNSANLSDDQRYGIFIEEKYYNRTDAAVVFKREDYWNGDVRFIYHGNDGTSMPWNDTAQLNYLNPEVREAVIQKILDVARMFPVIRFDAAMTLAKKHYQRLWFPEPGSGGDIPSRADYGMTRADFDRAIPEEFWREVVDRVAQEVSDTLLLAEAFWLMEGYFVRTLGMHRVYNSAFMNMLKNEENEKYRNTIRNTIQFNAEILKRYVNFMNNPDEETAVVQFGKGDKYFGVCLMMVTMPGLPMIGHGQIEGFSEKYGMEYRRAYWEEQVDWDLVHRHEREIFPLMRKRYLFAEVEHFVLYDFYTPQGYVNENVFAYSNRYRDERALVVYHNKFDDTRGWIKTAVPSAQKTGVGEEQQLVQKSLAESWSLQNDGNYFCMFRDQITGLEYIRSSKDLHDRGLYVELGAYHAHVFMNVQEVRDNVWGHYSKLNAYLNGQGVQSIQDELKELSFKPLLERFDVLFGTGRFEAFLRNKITPKKKKIDPTFLDTFKAEYEQALKKAKEFTSGDGKEEQVTGRVSKELETILQLQAKVRKLKASKSKKHQPAAKYLNDHIRDDQVSWAILYAWSLVHDLGKVAVKNGYEELSRSLIDEWLLNKRIHRLLAAAGANDEQIWEGKLLVNILTSRQNWFRGETAMPEHNHGLLPDLLKSQQVQGFLRVNRYDDVLWFNQESFERLVGWLFLIAAVQIFSDEKMTAQKTTGTLAELHEIIEKWLRAEKQSEFKLEKLLQPADGRKEKTRPKPKKAAGQVGKAKAASHKKGKR